ncbi:hypothetical protein D3C78_927530 [compost metagenome]
MQTVSKLNNDNTDILRHSNKHFPIVLVLLLFLGLEFDSLKLGKPINQHRTIIAELAPDFLQGYRSIFNHIMKKRGNNRQNVHMHAYDDFSNR